MKLRESIQTQKNLTFYVATFFSDNNGTTGVPVISPHINLYNTTSAVHTNTMNFVCLPSRHRWELPGNYPNVIGLVVIYLFFWITKIILVTTVI